MSDSYTKLFSSITASTIWQEPAGTRLTWITMLAMARKDGCVYASIPGLASQAKVSIAEVEAALLCFMSPDIYSRTKEHEGRRVEEIDGGWLLLNHAKFAAIRTAEERREYWREYKRKERAKDKCPPDLSTMSTESTEVTPLALSLSLALKDKRKASQAPPFVPPEWISRESWDGYIEMRTKARKPPTTRACGMVVRELERIRAAGHDPNKALDASTRNGWTDVYAPKVERQPVAPGVPTSKYGQAIQQIERMKNGHRRPDYVAPTTAALPGPGGDASRRAVAWDDGDLAGKT